jgi:hypothetical protein
VLVALAVTEMDCRHYLLLRRMSEALGGEQAFLRSCVHVHTALEGAQRAGNPLQTDPERASFIVRTVQDFLAARNLQLQPEDVLFPVVPQPNEVPEPQPAEQSGERPRRRIRNY